MSQATVLARREALDVLAALEREEALLFARKALATVAAADLFVGHDDPAAPFMALDVAMSCRVAQITATVRIRRSRHLVELLPRTLTGLQNQQLTVGQALALMDETEALLPSCVRPSSRRCFPGSWASPRGRPGARSSA